MKENTTNSYFGAYPPCHFYSPNPAMEEVLKDHKRIWNSSHLCKVGSDINDIFLGILPSLRYSVYINFHDIFFPFEYPKHWLIYHGIYWNEIYWLRSFLKYNSAFKIVLMNTFLTQHYTSLIRSNFPLCLKNTGGSIWLKKI